jgi:RNA polymerase sigma-70 factor (ECF subfamily)
VSGFDGTDWREVYARYAPALYRLALRMLGRDADAWDAVQEIFRRLIEHPTAWRGEAQPLTYLYRVMSNHCLNVLRAQGRVASSLEAAGAVSEGYSNATHELVEARALMRQLMGTLDERALQIAALHFIEGMTQEEIGAVVGLSRKWVGRELQRIQSEAQRLAQEHPRG